MAANNFTSQVYDKARNVATTHQFAGDWKKFITTTVQLSSLIGADGLSSTHAEGLDKLRTKLADAMKAPPSNGEGALTADKVLIAASKGGTPETKWGKRAATLKMLKHLYRYSKRGAQDVWIYSPPKAFSKWIYEEISGTEQAVAGKLKTEDEIYSEGDKKVMCDALKIALACAQKTEKLLGDASEETVKIVKRWFADSSTTAEQSTADVATLLTGFKKITALCNSSKLIFPDDPNDRKSMTKYDKLYGSVWPGGEGKFPVIYLAGAFKKAGNSGKLWLWLQTIIHEASHLEVSTKDHRYDTSGLKPGTNLSHAKAIENADSWGYFCIDLCGYLSNSDREQVWK